jgi:hypothetical protein
VTFPASLISSLIDLTQDRQFSLRSIDGSPIGLISVDYLRELVERDLVAAVGSRTRIKHFRLTEAQAEVDRLTGMTRQMRPKSPMDMLRAVLAGRNTVYRQKLQVRHPDGRVRCSVIFQHKRAVR